MSLILNIDTAVQTASICIADGNDILKVMVNPSQRDHAAWLQPAIRQALQDSDLHISQLDAIAVSSGPGSYTGLRVGMATAKGLCYALRIPLILISTLKMMCEAVEPTPTHYLAPMIDARRMEVFTALYDNTLKELKSPTNMILDETSFQAELDQHPILFFGNGSEKFEKIMNHPSAFFVQISADASHLRTLADEAFRAKQFADLAYAVPFYGKEFYSPQKQSL